MLWACCNVGAVKLETLDGSYVWDESEEKEVYNRRSYIHCGGFYETCHGIGSDSDGTWYILPK